jgi:hypothetical protein
MTMIPDNAFRNCTALTSITLPASVVSIGSYAFNGCSELTTVTILNGTPPELGTSAFSNSIRGIYVPASAVDAYKESASWSGSAARRILAIE